MLHKILSPNLNIVWLYGHNRKNIFLSNYWIVLVVELGSNPSNRLHSNLCIAENDLNFDISRHDQVKYVAFDRSRMDTPKATFAVQWVRGSGSNIARYVVIMAICISK